MEVSRRRIYKLLQPARPLRRLNIDPESAPRNAETRDSKDCSYAEDRPVHGVAVDEFCRIINLQTHSQPTVKKERISYSREFLIKLASSPVAKRKPDFLPDHPVVLEKPRKDLYCDYSFTHYRD